jgi:hypothetical protein
MELSEATQADGRARERGGVFLLGWALGFALLGAVLLGPVLDGGFFSDDWELYLGEPTAHLAHAFAEARPYEMYRPLQLLAYGVSESLFGYTTLPVHLLNLALHAGLAVAVLRTLLALGAPLRAAVLGGAYLTVSQLAGATVGGNDTISLTGATLAGSVAVFLASPLARPGVGPRALALVLLVVALLSKESALGYLPLVVLAAGLRFTREPNGLAKAALFAGCAVALTLAYLAVRAQSGGGVPDLEHGQQMRIGPNVFRNVALLAVAAVIPLRTTWVFVGMAQGRWLWPVLGVLSAVAVASFIVWGLPRGRRLLLVAIGIGAAGIVLSPTLLLLHISELYAYAILPFTALAFGWSANALLDSTQRWLRHGVAAFAGLALASNAWALHADSRGMAQSGALADKLMPQVLERMHQLPSGGTLVLVDPPDSEIHYSGFHLTGFKTVALAPREVPEVTGRGDVHQLWVRAGAGLPQPCELCTYVTLGAGGDEVVPFEPAASAEVPEK